MLLRRLQSRKAIGHNILSVSPYLGIHCYALGKSCSILISIRFREGCRRHCGRCRTEMESMPWMTKSCRPTWCASLTFQTRMMIQSSPMPTILKYLYQKDSLTLEMPNVFFFRQKTAYEMSVVQVGSFGMVNDGSVTR